MCEFCVCVCVCVVCVCVVYKWSCVFVVCLV